METLGRAPPGTTRLFTTTGGRGETVLSPRPTSSPDDPLNWSRGRKAWHTFVLLVITGFTPAMANTISATTNTFNVDYGITDNASDVAVALIFVGIGGGAYAFSPMPRLLGRRLMYLICLTFGVFGSVMFARVQHAGLLIASQLFLGICEACSEAAVQLSLSDIYFDHQMGTVIGLYVLAISGGTFLGPLVGGFIANNSTLQWPWVGWMGAIVGAAILVLAVLTLEETAFDRKTIEPQPVDAGSIEPGADKPGERDEQVLSDHRVSGDDPGEVTISPVGKKSYRARLALVTTTIQDPKTLLKEYGRLLWLTPRCFLWPAVFFSGLQWGFQVTWLTFYLGVEDQSYYLPPWSYDDAAVGIMSVPNLIGVVVGVLYGGVLADQFVHWKARRNGGVAEPEHRLWLMLPAIVLGPLGLLLFGLGGDRRWGWFPPYLGLGLLGFVWGCAGDISMTYMQQAYPAAILEGMVGIAVINNSFGVVFTMVSGPWIDGHSVTQIFGTLAVMAFLSTVIVLPLMYWGKDIRRFTAKSYLRFAEERGCD